MDVVLVTTIMFNLLAMIVNFDCWRCEHPPGGVSAWGCSPHPGGLGSSSGISTWQQRKVSFMDLWPRRGFGARLSPGALLVGVCLVAAVGCGGSGDGTTSAAETTAATTSATTTASTQACSDAAALRASIDDLDQLDLPSVGKGGLQDALQEIRTRLDALRSSAGDELAAPVDELNDAISALQDTVSGVQGDNLLSEIPTIISNLERVDQAWTSLQTRLDEVCATS